MTAIPNASPPPVFSLQNVSKRFGGQIVLREVSLEVPRGQRVVILGKSGSGKTVLLRILLGFLRPDDGKARVFGEVPPFSPYRQAPFAAGRLGVLFQNDALFEDQTVAGNLALAVRSRWSATQMDGAEVVRRSAVLIGKVGMPWTEIADRKPSELSGGMRKRVALARALACEPQAALIDEPTSGLDAETAGRIVDLLAQTLRGDSVTAVIITHDRQCARRLADRAYRLDDRTGRLEEVDLARLDEVAGLDDDLPPGAEPTFAPRAATAFRLDPVGALGSFFEALGRCAASIGRALSPPPRDEFLRRLRVMALGSVPLVAAVFFMMGMSVYVQIHLALAPLGQYTRLPQVMMEAGLKLTPAVIGLIMTGKVGSAICAEMALLRQTEQFEAMRVLGLEPERRLLGPWLWSSLAAFPLLTLFAEAVAGCGALFLLTAMGAGHEITATYFWRESFDSLNVGRLAAGLVKGALFGAAITLTAYFFGAREQHGASSVGRSITAALVVSFILIMAGDFLVNVATTGL
ncbi:MAG: ABC transporter permease [Candidatus Sumerlaeota bacterium]|nr:ABC transporter permease [Candidatus Sumerlaeota bacterium]